MSRELVMMLLAAACWMRWESRGISRLIKPFARGKRFLPTTSAIRGQPPELLRTHYYITGLNISTTTRGKGKGRQEKMRRRAKVDES